MSTAQALAAFLLAASLLTVTPGVDTALVLRTAAVEGARRAAWGALGIVGGVLLWGAAVALGLGALIATSALGFNILRWAGAAYLVWLGLNLVLRPRDRLETATGAAAEEAGDFAWMRRGLLTNLLNPKMGVFYFSFLPQFIPVGVAPAPFMFLLAAIHAALGAIWFACLIGAARPISGLLQRGGVIRWLDRLTGCVFLGFGVRLAMAPR